MILEVVGDALHSGERRILNRVATSTISNRSIAKFTSILEDYARPVPPERQILKALELFKTRPTLTTEECAELAKVEDIIRQLSSEIRKNFNQSDFKRDRLNRIERQNAGLEISKRRYNKLFRHLARLEQKARTYARERRKYEIMQIGWLGLAARFSWEDFSRDENSACFIAYYVARSNLLSEFTTSGQQHAFDKIARILLYRCKREPERANWWAIAHVFPKTFVLEQLSDTQKGQLLGICLTVLHDIAELLREVWEKSNIDRETMINVNDSSTWNNAAKAWNRVRASWIELLHSMNMKDELDSMYFGKVLRLIESDQLPQAWHRAARGGLDPDAKVWSEVPLPWEVLSGGAICTKKLIGQVCHKYGVDPLMNGWIVPPPAGGPPAYMAKFMPTSGFVYGVMSSNPQIATVLRRVGWFSDKRGVPPF